MKSHKSVKLKKEEEVPSYTTNSIPKKLKQVNYSQDNYKIKDSSTRQAVDVVICKMNFDIFVFPRLRRTRIL